MLLLMARLPTSSPHIVMPMAQPLLSASRRKGEIRRTWPDHCSERL